MMDSVRKLYTAKKPAHPEDAHTKAKRFFKTRGRKRVRKMLKEDLKRSVTED